MTVKFTYDNIDDNDALKEFMIMFPTFYECDHLIIEEHHITTPHTSYHTDEGICHRLRYA